MTNVQILCHEEVVYWLCEFINEENAGEEEFEKPIIMETLKLCIRIVKHELRDKAKKWNFLDRIKRIGVFPHIHHEMVKRIIVQII